MTKTAKAYSIALSALVPGSALSAMANSCHTSAWVCAITAVALSFEKFRATLDKKAGNEKRIDALEARNHLKHREIEIKMANIQETIASINFDDIVARSEEIKSALSTLKLNNLYNRGK